MRRHKWNIFAEILTAALSPVTSTKIMYRSNLNYGLMKGYLSTLLERGLVEVVVTNPNTKFLTTGSGREWLRFYRELRRLLKE